MLKNDLDFADIDISFEAVTHLMSNVEWQAEIY